MTKQPVDVRVLARAVASVMWADFDQSAASARPDHKGLPRERRVRDFLRSRLPKKFGVTRGHVIIEGDTTSNEFDVIVYDSMNCPSWPLETGEDPRSLVPLEAVLGVIEVKSTLRKRELDEALQKIQELDVALSQRNEQLEYRPFRHIFSYRCVRDVPFGSGGVGYDLTSYAGARTQPDGIFVLDTGFAVLDVKDAIGLALALKRGQSLDEALADSWDIQSEIVRRDVAPDPSYCNDYFATDGSDGVLLLAFLIFILDHISAYKVVALNWTDVFCRWGPTLEQ